MKYLISLILLFSWGTCVASGSYEGNIRIAEIHLKNENYESALKALEKAESIDPLGEEVLDLRNKINDLTGVNTVEIFENESEISLPEVEEKSSEEPEMLFGVPKDEAVLYISVFGIFILFVVLFFVGTPKKNESKDEDPLSMI